MAYRMCVVPQEVMERRGDRPLEIRVSYTCPDTGAELDDGPMFEVQPGTIVKCSDAIALRSMDEMEGHGSLYFAPVLDEPPPDVDVDLDELLEAHLEAEPEDQPEP